MISIQFSTVYRVDSGDDTIARINFSESAKKQGCAGSFAMNTEEGVRAIAILEAEDEAHAQSTWEQIITLSDQQMVKDSISGEWSETQSEILA